MKKYLLLLITILCFSFCYSQDAVSTWMTVKVDGHPNEWSKPLRYYDESTRLFYAFANDSTTLYLCFQAAEEMDQRKITKAGMTVTLTTKGRIKNKASISFPLPQPEQPHQKDQMGEKSRQTIINTFLMQNTIMDVKGFATREGQVSINDSSGIKAAINWDDSYRLIYEIAIPLKELYGGGYTATDLANPLTLSVLVNGLKQPKFAGQNGGEEHNMGMGQHGGQGEGSHRGQGHEESNTEISSSQREIVYQKGKLSQKFTLALRP